MYENVLEMATKAIRGTVDANFSAGETSEGLRKAFIEMNGGSTKINPKTFVRGNALFALVEEMLPVIIEEGLKDNDFIMNLVDYKNVKDGDLNEFYTEHNAAFVVADAAAGIQGVRRQRLSGGSKTTVKTQMKIVRVYEELNRLLAGRTDFDAFIQNVSNAFKQQILNDAFKAINGVGQGTAGLNAGNVYAGTFDEEKLVEMIEHIEAYTGKVARIYGTKAALRKVTTAVVSQAAQKDLYDLGYYGKFNGTDMVCLRQAHKAGTREFILDSNKILIIAGDDRPVKMVNEGEGIMIDREPTANNDFTREYVYGQAYGTGVICSEQIGIYTIA